MLDRKLRVAVSLVAALSLSACMGSNGGGGGGGPVTAADFDENYDRVTSVAPTTDMPTTIEATYTGAVKADVLEGSATVGELLADLELELNWTDDPAVANEVNVWAGSVTNVRGTVDGEEFVAEGQLDVVPDLSAMRRDVTTISVPGVGDVTTETGSAQINLAGTLTVDGETANAGMLLGGTCFGPECAALAGTAGGSISDNPLFPEYVLSGEFYAER